MEWVARCDCGQLQIRCTGEPAKVSVCHCLACQRRTGSAFGIAAFFEAKSTEVIGTSKPYRRSSDSGFPIVFHFCGTCASTVFWYPSRKSAFVAVAVGCFADPRFPAPEQAVYSEHRHRWVAPLGKERHDPTASRNEDPLRVSGGGS
ncbi:MAG TPA: GFA family protein [Roseomonas sp.]|nr:GFA family protein [Roseomonas sp.]